MSSDMKYETKGTTCYGHWVLGLVLTGEKGYEFLRSKSSASCVLLREIRGTICHGHWFLPFVISHTRQGVRVVAGI